MTVVFFSNVLNHHQVALCDALYSLLGADFTFVEISCLNAERREMGFSVYERPYKLNAQNSVDKAQDLARNADVAIMGAESYGYLKLRINQSKGLTFSYSERWLKQGLKNVLSPSILRQALLYMTIGRQKKWYMLCASGFLLNDLKKFFLFNRKCFKWGYFPNYQSNRDRQKVSQPVKILWVGRFLDWKHPKMMIELANMLHNVGYDFRIKMIGNGEGRKKILESLKGIPAVTEKIELPGSLPNAEVITSMKCSDILCFTSDRQEGWGAVLAEAMAVGCCPVASSQAGATPFLIQDEKNGLIFKSESSTDLFNKITCLIDSPTKIKEFGTAAAEMIHSHWTAKVAANNFIKLSKVILTGQDLPDFTGEPCEQLK